MDKYQRSEILKLAGAFLPNADPPSDEELTTALYGYCVSNKVNIFDVVCDLSSAAYYAQLDAEWQGPRNAEGLPDPDARTDHEEFPAGAYIEPREGESGEPGIVVAFYPSGDISYRYKGLVPMSTDENGKITYKLDPIWVLSTTHVTKCWKFGDPDEESLAVAALKGAYGHLS